MSGDEQRNSTKVSDLILGLSSSLRNLPHDSDETVPTPKSAATKFGNAQEELSAKFQSKRPTPGVQPLSSLFKANDATLDNVLTKSRKKRVYKLSRPVKKKLAIIREASRGDAIKPPTAHRMKQLKEDKLVLENILIHRTWTAEELRSRLEMHLGQHFQFLRPVKVDQSKPYTALEHWPADPSAKELLEAYGTGVYIHVTKQNISDLGTSNLGDDREVSLGRPHHGPVDFSDTLPLSKQSTPKIPRKRTSCDDKQHSMNVLHHAVVTVPSIGNSCYLSAALALLQRLPCYADIQNATCENDSAMDLLQTLMLHAEHNDEDAIYTSACRLLQNCSYEPGQQCDAMEFLSTLLDGIYDDTQITDELRNILHKNIIVETSIECNLQDGETTVAKHSSTVYDISHTDEVDFEEAIKSNCFERYPPIQWDDGN